MTLFGSVARLARLSSRRQLSTSAPRAGDHGWSYRTTPYPTSDFLAKASTGIMTFTWWWIFHGTIQYIAKISDDYRILKIVGRMIL